MTCSRPAVVVGVPIDFIEWIATAVVGTIVGLAVFLWTKQSVPQNYAVALAAPPLVAIAVIGPPPVARR